MTCIAAVAENGVVHMGGDSAGVAGLSLTVRADEKVFLNGPFLMGFTSSFRMGQLLRYSFHPPEHPADMDIDTYMVTVFVDAVRDCLKKGGYARNDSGEESGGTFLVGYRGQLFEIESDYQVGRPAHHFAAVGCGAHLALGALHATEDKLPQQRVRQALEAAEQFSAGVRGPFLIMQSPPPEAQGSAHGSRRAAKRR